jgi:hypothetical protein
MHKEDTKSGPHVTNHMKKWKLMSIKVVIFGCICYDTFLDHTFDLANSLRLHMIHDPCINQIHTQQWYQQMHHVY